MLEFVIQTEANEARLCPEFIKLQSSIKILILLDDTKIISTLVIPEV